MWQVSRNYIKCIKKFCSEERKYLRIFYLLTTLINNLLNKMKSIHKEKKSGWEKGRKTLFLIERSAVHGNSI